MKSKSLFASVASAALLVSALFAGPATARTETGFSALEGIDAQALSHQEMDAITGELNALDIAAALTATAAKLDRFPRLQAAVLRLAAYYANNADRINAFFDKLGVLTPCQSCAP